MNESFPTPMDLSDNPELAVLEILKINLEVAKRVLLASYPSARCGEPCFESCHSEQEAYANGILYQSDALTAIVQAYVESTRRLDGAVKGPTCGVKPSREDIPF
jgi:hypothetical protein